MDTSTEIYTFVHENHEAADEIGDIYCKIDITDSQGSRSKTKDFIPQRTLTAYPGTGSSGRKSTRGVAACLGLLSILLMAGVIGLVVYYNREMDSFKEKINLIVSNSTNEQQQFQTRYNEMTEERDQCQTRYNAMTRERNQIQTRYNELTEERNQFQTRYDAMTRERDQFQTRYNAMTREKDQLQTRYNKLTEERNQFQTRYDAMTRERDQFQTRYNDMTRERDQIQTRYNAMTKEKDQLQTRYNALTRERDQLQTRYNAIPEKLSIVNQHLQPGWRYYKSSLYFISTEKKTWEDSRRDCEEKNADLLIIKSREEQVYLHGLNNEVFWIGLTDKKHEGKWMWVDGTELTTGYWAGGQPDNRNNMDEDCAARWSGESNPEKSWHDAPCNELHYWMCEEKFQL